jgi:hypothetical protein
LESIEINAPSEIFKSSRPEEIKQPAQIKKSATRRKSPSINSGRKSLMSSAKKSPLKSARN